MWEIYKVTRCRSLFGGRYNFSARSVITPNPALRIDEVRLPYKALVELLQQSIINILQKSYNINYSEAYKIWYKGKIAKNQRIWDIIESLIKNNKRGLPVLINRNPTIGYGSILQMFVVGINDTYTMNVPLQCLKGLAADFDGDTLNILHIINKEFFNHANMVFNPANCMYVSMNDGMFNNDTNHSKDTLINANTMIQLARDKYTPQQLERIKQCQSMK